MASTQGNMGQRPGVTLTEVLVAIFVAALGLLGILALFPIGALNMAQAIKDDRTGHAAADAKSIADIWHVRTDSNDPPFPPPGFGYPPYWQAAGADTYRHPGGEVPPPFFADGVVYPDRTGYAGPSYPVYVDPIGYKAYGPSKPLGGIIPRKSCRFLNDPLVDIKLLGNTAYQNRQTARWFSLLDDINFTDTAVPDLSASIVQRQGRYSWAYMCFMPSAAANSSTVDLSVVVYSGRSLQLNGLLQPSGEAAYPATFPQSNVITLSYPSFDTKPTIRKGSWILEAGNPKPNPPSLTFVDVHSYFYRVVNVIDPGQNGGNTIDLELQTNIKNLGTVSGTVIVMDNVEEVFECGTATTTTGQQGIAP